MSRSSTASASVLDSVRWMFVHGLGGQDPLAALQRAVRQGAVEGLDRGLPHLLELLERHVSDRRRAVLEGEAARFTCRS